MCGLPTTASDWELTGAIMVPFGAAMYQASFLLPSLSSISFAYKLSIDSLFQFLVFLLTLYFSLLGESSGLSAGLAAVNS